jgi:hypothetical protein
MEMESMRFGRRQLGAHEHQICVGNHAGFALPKMRFARQPFHFGLVE